MPKLLTLPSKKIRSARVLRPGDLPRLGEAQAEKARRRLASFVRYAWHILEPGTPLVWNWHIDAICEHAQAVTEGHIKNLLINIPPGHMKSLIISCFWPAWEWIEHPEQRSLFASYAMELSLRDSVRFRDLISSDWYLESFGPAWGWFAEDWEMSQSEQAKSNVANTRKGFRLAMSVGGRGTGFRGDKIVCLDGSVPLRTDAGDIPIGRIVDEKLPVRVLGSSGTWQAIEAYEKNPGRPMLEITTESGAVLRCTEDHRIFIDGHGFIPAFDAVSLLSGDKKLGNIYMRHLRETVQQSTGTRGTGQRRTVLLKGLFRAESSGREESSLVGRPGPAGLSDLQKGVRGKAGRGGGAYLLLSRLPGQSTDGREDDNLPGVSEGVPSHLVPSKTLLEGVCEQAAPADSTRRGERSVCSWSVGDGLRAGISEKSARCGSAKRRQPVRSLRRGEAIQGAADGPNAPGAPYRRFQRQPRTDQPGHAVHPVSPAGSHQVRHSAGLDAKARIVSIRRCPAPAAVYNVRVSPDHDYYAAGLLVHNCDDPLNAKNAHSEAALDECVFWWDKVMPTRLNDPRTGKKVVIMQRLTEKDLSGHILEGALSGTYQHLCLPSEFEPEKKSMTMTGLGLPFWEDPRTERGELLFPEVYTGAVLADTRRTLGEDGYSGQHQQDPVPAGGGMFKEWWWRYWCWPGQKLPPVIVRLADGSLLEIEAEELPHTVTSKGVKTPVFDEQLQSWDMAFKDTKHSDFVAGGVWGRWQANRYLLDQVCERMSFTETIKQVRALSLAWPEAHLKLVEDKANGPAIIDSLSSSLQGLVAVEPEGGKEARAAAVSPQIESHNVFLPHPSIYPWVLGFRAQCSAFPKGANDDQVDQMTQALLRMMQQGEGQMLPSLYR